MPHPLPTIGITLGDVAGVGPEVLVHAWTTGALLDVSRPLVLGCPAVLRHACQLLGQKQISIQTIEQPEDAAPTGSVIPCIRATEIDLEGVKPGRIDPRAGRAAYDFLIAGIDLALAGRVDALVTLPLNKTGLAAAGIGYPGHTEILAERCGARRHAMMLYVGPGTARGAGGLGVVHATLHVSLAKAISSLNSSTVFDAIVLAEEAMAPMLSQRRPRVAVAGVNPHAGEEGLFGDEETHIIAPAIAKAAALGIDVHGPIAADTLFRRAFDGEFDAVVAMYHDQGHVAVKSVAFWEAVNVTLGLPIIRTSVAHGTAYDIAGTGRAQSHSLLEAVRVAAAFVAAKRPISAVRR